MFGWARPVYVVFILLTFSWIQKAYCLVAIPITLMSALAVMFFEQEPFGNVRSFNEDFRCYESSNKSYQVENQIHRKQMLSWFYVLLISSNILVVACFVQLMAFFTIWVLNVLEVREGHRSNCNVNEDVFTNNSVLTFGQRQETSYIPLSILKRRSFSYCYVIYTIFMVSLQRQKLKRSKSFGLFCIILLTIVRQLWFEIKITSSKKQIKFRDLCFICVNTKIEVHLFFAVAAASSHANSLIGTLSFWDGKT